MSRNYQEHPELYPWVEPMLRQIQMDHNNEFDRFLRKQEELQARCLCEYDGGYGDDGSIVKRFPHPDCPVHREEGQEAA